MAGNFPQVPGNFPQMAGAYSPGMASMTRPASNSVGVGSGQNFGGIGEMRLPSQVTRPPAAIASPTLPAKKDTVTTQRRDVLDFDVFSDFRALEPSSESSSKSENPPQAPAEELLPEASSAPSAFPAVSVSDDAILLNDHDEENLLADSPNLLLDTANNTPSPPAPMKDDYFVPLESIEPTTHSPIVVLDKDGLKTMLVIAKDKRSTVRKDVIVTILSTISTCTDSVTDFNVKVAVPKSLRAKLQPASGTNLNAFNPILPPSSITQVMLITNLNQEDVRIRFQIGYTIRNTNQIETVNIDQFPRF